MRGETNDLWLWPGDVPRTCSYCGGIHPEDAIRLVTEGWEVEATGKSYKRYLNPPGTAAKRVAVLANLRAGISQMEVTADQVWGPTPPAKLYTDHLNDEQIGRFNAALKDAVRPH